MGDRELVAHVRGHRLLALLHRVEVRAGDGAGGLEDVGGLLHRLFAGRAAGVDAHLSDAEDITCHGLAFRSMCSALQMRGRTGRPRGRGRSEAHTYEIKSKMRTSNAD